MLTFTWIDGKLIKYDKFTRNHFGIDLLYKGKRVTGDWGISYYDFDKLTFFDARSTKLTKILYGLL